MARARAYQVDELLKLRQLCKASSDVLRRITSEAGIKDILMAKPNIASPNTFLSNYPGQLQYSQPHQEHVLRSSSNSSDPFPFRSRQRSSSIITNPYDGYENPPVDSLGPFRARTDAPPTQPIKISPTPSIKRGKAERLLKEHGSPPGIRVTAGGRIVPDGLTPITSPRSHDRQHSAPQHLAHISIPRIDLSNLPSFSYLQSVEGYLVLGESQIFQVHNGHLVPVGRAGNPALSLVCPPANQVLTPGAPCGGVDVHVPQYQMESSFYPPNPEHEAIDEHTLGKLDECHGKFQQELRELDRNEVLQRDSLTTAGKREIVRRRIDLVNRIDETRRSIIRARKVLKDRDMAASDTSVNYHGAHMPLMTLPPPATAPVSQQLASISAPMAYGFTPNYPFAPPDYPQYAMMTSAISQQAYAYGAPPMPASLHTGADFVPIQAQEEYPLAANLQSRAGNAGLGISNTFGPVDEKYVVGKQHDVSTGPKSINLDGSGHQPRRSHAVTIKAPEPGSKDKKMALNPASQSYQPRERRNEQPQHVGDGYGDEAAKHSVAQGASGFMPSADMVAGVDQLVDSPQRNPAVLDKGDSRSKYGASSSTASTSDFFPQDTDDYSASKYAYSGRNQASNLGGWMTEEHDTGRQNTPKRAVSKHIWNASPKEHFLDPMPDHDGRPQTAFAAAASSPVRGSRSSAAASSPLFATTDNLHAGTDLLSGGRRDRPNASRQGHSHEATIISDDSPAASMVGIKSRRGSSLQRSDSGTGLRLSPSQKLYRLGLQDGLGNKLDRVHSEFEYLQGLRDGLQQRTKHVDEDSSLGRGSVSLFNTPAAPVNSPLSTPRSASSFDGKFSPATALAFSSQPNVKVVDMQRSIGPQRPAIPRLRSSDQHTSPLTERHGSPFVDAGRQLSPAESFSARMYRLQMQERQRAAKADDGPQKPYGKRAAPGVVASEEHIRVVFPQQDGPTEDMEAKQQQQQHRDSHVRSHAPPAAITRYAVSPANNNSTQQSGCTSPGKRLTSAAASVLAFGRKLKSPEPGSDGPKSPASNKPGSRTKSRAAWRRRIEDKIVFGPGPLSPK